jgi:hypothetical protein
MALRLFLGRSSILNKPLTFALSGIVNVFRISGL